MAVNYEHENFEEQADASAQEALRAAVLAHDHYFLLTMDAEGQIFLNDSMSGLSVVKDVTFYGALAGHARFGEAFTLHKLHDEMEDADAAS